MSLKTFLWLLLLVVVVVGATGGEDSVRRVGDALDDAVHWVGVAWESLIDDDQADA